MIHACECHESKTHSLKRRKWNLKRLRVCSSVHSWPRTEISGFVISLTSPDILCCCLVPGYFTLGWAGYLHHPAPLVLFWLGQFPWIQLETGSVMVLNMAVIHCLVLTSRNIQLSSPLGSTAWLRLGLLSKLGQILLPEDPFGSGAWKQPSVLSRFSASSSPLSASILCLDIVSKKLLLQGLPQTQSCLWRIWGKVGWRNVFHQAVTFQSQSKKPLDQ